jgi:hypothetical protein
VKPAEVKIQNPHIAFEKEREREFQRTEDGLVGGR